MPGATLPTQADVESYFKRLNNWGRWGHDDQRGTVNLITDARRAAARALVKSGRTVSLSREIVAQPHLQFMYHVTCPSKRERADVVLDRFDLVYHGFWITHVDALCHVGWDGELYNGRRLPTACPPRARRGVRSTRCSTASSRAACCST